MAIRATLIVQTGVAIRIASSVADVHGTIKSLVWPLPAARCYTDRNGGLSDSEVVVDSIGSQGTTRPRYLTLNPICRSGDVREHRTQRSCDFSMVYQSSMNWSKYTRRCDAFRILVSLSRNWRFPPERGFAGSEQRPGRAITHSGVSRNTCSAASRTLHVDLNNEETTNDTRIRTVGPFDR